MRPLWPLAFALLLAVPPAAAESHVQLAFAGAPEPVELQAGEARRMDLALELRADGFSCFRDARVRVVLGVEPLAGVGFELVPGEAVFEVAAGSYAIEPYAGSAPLALTIYATNDTVDGEMVLHAAVARVPQGCVAPGGFAAKARLPVAIRVHGVAQDVDVSRPANDTEEAAPSGDETADDGNFTRETSQEPTAAPGGAEGTLVGDYGGLREDEGRAIPVLPSAGVVAAAIVAAAWRRRQR